MCGIAGVVGAAEVTRIDLVDRAAAMSTAIAHRGPDADDIWCDEAAGVAFAHRRLAIIDLSEHGNQPMVSADGRWVIAFNGEIYNHRVLAERLSSGGVRLRGHSDTEVLLEMIAHYSLREALAAANGMFAFALWDRRDRTVSLVRDRLGEKPLYYALLGGSLVFASELTALRQYPGFSPSLDRRALALFVRHSFVPGERSIYEGVRRLPPGTLLAFRRGDPLPDPEPYWTLEQTVLAGASTRSRPPDSDPTVLVDEAEALLMDAVRLRMVSDVPLGGFLSGGIDSSLVVALMQRVSAAPIRSFTVSVGGSGDEANHAAAVAAHLGTEHHQIDLSASEALRFAVETPLGYDEPFADPSAIPTMLLCAAAREHVTVCLSGDGGDEIAAGYNRYLAAEGWINRLGNSPGWLRRPAARALLALPAHRVDALASRLPVLTQIPDTGSKVHKLGRLLAAGSGHDAYRALTTFVDPAQVMLDADEHATLASAPPGSLADLGPLDRMLYLDQSITLPDDMLVKVDRASMRVALECRVPLLDHRLVELLWGWSPAMQRRGGQGKWLFRRILDRHVPRELVDRPKQGFDPPLASWLRGPLRDWTRDLLQPDRLRAQGVFEPVAVNRLLMEHDSGKRNHDYAIWTLVTFQAWLDAQHAPAAVSSPRTVGA